MDSLFPFPFLFFFVSFVAKSHYEIWCNVKEQLRPETVKPALYFGVVYFSSSFMGLWGLIILIKAESVLLEPVLQLYYHHLSCTLWSPAFQSVVGHFRPLAYYLTNPTRGFDAAMTHWYASFIFATNSDTQRGFYFFYFFFCSMVCRVPKRASRGGLKADEDDRWGEYRFVWEYK